MIKWAQGQKPKENSLPAYVFYEFPMFIYFISAVDLMELKFSIVSSFSWRLVCFLSAKGPALGGDEEMPCRHV